MAQNPMLRKEIGMRVRFTNKTSAEWFKNGRGIGQFSRKICKKGYICGCLRKIKWNAREQISSRHAEHKVPFAKVKVCLSAHKAPIICRWPEVPRNPFPPPMPTVYDCECVSQTARGVLTPLSWKATHR